MVSGVCEQDCAIPNGTLGITNGTTVVKGTTSKTCNASSYSGAITYTCNGGGASAVITANNCATSCTASVSPSTYNGKTVFTFLSNGTFSCSTSQNVEVLVVGGGGSGGSSSNEPSTGGGGGGGVVYSSAYPISAGTTYNAVIGAGGVRSTLANSGIVCVGTTGQNSTFGTITALGGGGGGTGYGYAQTACTGTKAALNALSGGSGGGGANNSTSFAAPGSSTQTAQTNATAFYGNSGGSVPSPCEGATAFKRCGGAGGGGGAGFAGSNALTVDGAKGGDGIQISSISANYYGGGGGGSRAYKDPLGGLTTIANYSAGAGGIGGGGAGGVNGGSGIGTAGSPNTGGGGGSNASGGSGIVIIAY